MKMTGAQIIISLLEKQGVTEVAGIPGGSILPLYNELAQSNIRHILVRQEQAAGFIAQGMSRSTGKTAVCMATSGPGAMNLLTAIADARCDSIPLVVITGQVNTTLIGTDAFQEADTFGLSFPITKHSILIQHVEDLVTAIPQAFAIAQSGRPGPVLIDVPRDIQTAECDIADSVFEAKSDSTYCAPVRFATPANEMHALIEQFCAVLLGAQKPVLYVGGGCNVPEVASQLQQLLKTLSIPVVSSLMGIGCVPCKAPYYLGMLGMHGSYAANSAMYDSDVVLALGTHFDDRAIGLANEFCPHAKILHVDIDAAEINKIYPAHTAIVADVKKVLPLLCTALERNIKNGDYTSQGVQKKRYDNCCSLRQSDYSELLGKSKDSMLPNPRSFIAALPEKAALCGLTADDIIVTTDVGQHQMWVAQYYPFVYPRTFLTSGSLGTMGFGLPAAIGAALANTDKRVVCFTGDGSIMMNIQELATLAELNLPVTIVLFQNGTLGMVRQQQKYLFDRTFSASVFMQQTDFIAVAKGFGIRTVDATADQQWYTEAFAHNEKKPCLVLVKIDPEEDVLPYVKSGYANIDAIR
ncbi:MAG: biosynthetic-type acetolactate synthase large subunit [Treponema sp.]|nr:biosynthetic-type acetolactate synthase large subunit [Treponema sp.]